MNIWIADIECYINYLLLCLKNPVTGERKYFEITDYGINDSIALRSFILDKSNVFVGWNFKNYDLFIMLYWADLAINKNNIDIMKTLYKISQYIFNKNRIHKDVKHYANTKMKYIDLMEVLRKGYNTSPLKIVGVVINHEKIEDLPYPFDTILTKEQTIKVRTYCWNDIDMTEKVYEICKPLLKMRASLGKLLKLDLLTEADSAITDKVFDKFYKEEANLTDEQFKKIASSKTVRGDMYLKDIINMKVPFTNAKLISFHDYIITKKLHKTNKESYHIGDLDSDYCIRGKKENSDKCVGWKIKIFDNEFTLGLGGIHTTDPAGVFKENDEYTIIDIDVEAFYPFKMLIDGIGPEHLDIDIFLNVLKRFVDMRIMAKKMKHDPDQQILNAGLKIVINGTYGKLGFKYRWLYDLLCMYKVTLNNQLDILRLCEYIYNAGHKIISANTDGVTCMVKRTEIESFREAYKAWEDSTSLNSRIGKGFKLEEAHYAVVARLNVNNYMAVKTDGSWKVKGKYFDLDRYNHPISPDALMKGYEFPIIPKVLFNFFYNKLSPEFTINESIKNNKVFDFCIANKIGKDFANELRMVKNKEIKTSEKTGKPYKIPKIIKETLAKSDVQDTVRYFMSNPVTKAEDYSIGYELIKVSRKDGKEISHQKNKYIYIVNDYDESKNYTNKVNIDYYIEQSYKLIDIMIHGKDAEEIADEDVFEDSTI